MGGTGSAVRQIAHPRPYVSDGISAKIPHIPLRPHDFQLAFFLRYLVAASIPAWRRAMSTKTKSLMAQTAGDLMSRDVIRLREDMPLRDAARLMMQSQIGGAPVVNAEGKCIGVFSSMDFLRLAQTRVERKRLASPPLPMTCAFQAKSKNREGEEVTVCTLPPGVCPIQVKQVGQDDQPITVCTQPHCVLVDWQVVDFEKLPTDELRAYMITNPVTAAPTTCIRTLARMMIDAHIHRLIVVDKEQRPIGIVSSTDLLAAMAFSEDEE
jgi:CBS domain-containing protein